MTRRQAKLTWKGREASFTDRVEIGRGPRAGEIVDGRFELNDPTISSRHCILTQQRDGRFLVRDLSRNGTRVDGRRLVPNIEFEIEPGQTLYVGSYEIELFAEAEQQRNDMEDLSDIDDSTLLIEDLAVVTLLVGDIRGYTTLNQKEDPALISPAVTRVFSGVEEVVNEHDGSLKEYHGDAVLAFWEADPKSPGTHAVRAMDAALALQDHVSALAASPEVWPFSNFPLQVDFALTTGPVVISSFGKDRPTGLSMVGEAINVAFRIEKLANENTGTILACDTSQRLVQDRFEFDDLGDFEVAGLEGRPRVFALRGRL